jgi:hypothetical protein
LKQGLALQAVRDRKKAQSINREAQKLPATNAHIAVW